MAQYTVKDSQTGKTVTFNWYGKSAPTEQDMKEVFAEADKSTPKPSLFDRFKEDISQRIADNDTLAEFGKNTGVPILDNLLKTLPVVGATGGAILGTPADVVSGPGGTVLGAGVGGAAGKSLENVLRRVTGIGEQPTSPIMSPIKTGAEMAAWEAGVPVLLNVLSKIAGPAAAKFAQNFEGQALQKISDKEGLPFSPSTIQPSKTAKVIEGAVNLFPTGKAVSTKYQNDLYKWLLNSRSEFLQQMTGKGVGEGSFLRSSGETGATARQGVRDAYKNVVGTAGGEETIIPLQNTKQYFDDIYETAPKNLKEIINDFRTRMAKSGPSTIEGEPIGMTAKDFDEFTAVVSKKGKGIKDNINKIIDQDITIFDKAEGTKVSEEMKKAGSEWFKTKGYDHIEGLFRKATIIGRSGEEVFSPGAFYKMVMAPGNQKFIADKFGKPALENMKDYAELVRKIGEETGKKEMSKIGQVVQQGMVGGGVAAPFVSPQLLIPYGIAPVLAWKMMQPRSVFKKWLTEGFKGSKTAAEGLKVGGRAAIAESNE